jgi:hypothetical protein
MIPFKDASLMATQVAYMSHNLECHLHELELFLLFTFKVYSKKYCINKSAVAHIYLVVLFHGRKCTIVSQPVS